MQEFNLPEFLFTSLEIMAVVFIFVIGLIILAIIVTFIIDVTQKKQAIRRNFPVIGRFRYLFETLGEFFRQYFLPWTGKNYLLIEHNVFGFIAPLKMFLTRVLLVRPKIFVVRVRCYL